MTGTYEFGNGSVPIRQVIGIAVAALPAHIEHGLHPIIGWRPCPMEAVFAHPILMAMGTTLVVLDLRKGLVILISATQILVQARQRSILKIQMLREDKGR